MHRAASRQTVGGAARRGRAATVLVGLLAAALGADAASAAGQVRQVGPVPAVPAPAAVPAPQAAPQGSAPSTPPGPAPAGTAAAPEAATEPAATEPAAASPADDRFAGPADAATRKREREAALAELRQSMEVSAERRRELEAEIAALDKDRASLNDALIAAGERVGKLETAITGSEQRLTRARESAAAIRLSLAERRGVLAEVLAALERIGGRPPPALLVAPDDARDALRSAILLGAVLPELKVEAEALAADLAALARVEADIERERRMARADLASLGEERTRLELLVEEKRRLRSASAEALAAEQREAEALAAKADTLEHLIGRLEREVTSARDAAEAARQAAGTARPGVGDPERLTPAVAFASIRGALPLPVAGRIAGRFGEPDGDGGHRQGTTIEAAAGAQITAPADGWVVYAGPFRSYGQILILNMGDGYHVLLAGMERIDVGLGQFVLAGEPVGSMGGGVPIGAVATGSGSDGVEAGSSGQASLYVEFRKDGSSIDSAPWWAARLDEEVRG